MEFALRKLSRTLHNAKLRYLRRGGRLPGPSQDLCGGDQSAPPQMARLSDPPKTLLDMLNEIAGGRHRCRYPRQSVAVALTVCGTVLAQPAGSDPGLTALVTRLAVSSGAEQGPAISEVSEPDGSVSVWRQTFPVSETQLI
jgi:hypothetical protein